MEYLVALTVLSITIGGIAYATLGAGDVGKAGDKNARLNALVTSFGEAVKALPYQDCAGGSAYAVNAADLTDSSEAQVEVLNVEVDCTSGVDPGVQTVTLRATIGGRTTERTVVKRTPESAMKPLRFSIVDPGDRLNPPTPDPALWWGPVGDTNQGIHLRAQGESDIFQYEWWCPAPPISEQAAWAAAGGGDYAKWGWVDPEMDPRLQPNFTTAVRNDSRAQCLIESRPANVNPLPQFDAADPAYAYVTLRVTEAVTGRTGVQSIRVLRPPTAVAAQRPTAIIEVIAPGLCDSAVPCILGADRTVDVKFNSSGSFAPDGEIVMLEWNFADGTPPLLCFVPPPPPPPADRFENPCSRPVHRYQGGGQHEVKLKVHDNGGRSSVEASRTVVIGGLPIIKPTVANVAGVSGLTADPTVGFATATMPLNVRFDASGSHAHDVAPGAGSPPGGIAEYEWDFDINDGNDVPDVKSLNATPSHTYFNSTDYPKTVRARVTVTDIYGFSMFSEVEILVQPFAGPPSFNNVGARADCNWPLIIATLGFGCRSPRDGYFDYQWTNAPRAPGDNLTIEVRMSQAAGWGLCTATGLFGVSTRSFVAGAPGTVQSARYAFNTGTNDLNRGYNGICAIADGYQFEVRSVLTNQYGTFESPWSLPRKTRTPQL